MILDRLTVITPCARPANIPLLASAIADQGPWQRWDFHWTIVHDCRSGPCDAMHANGADHSPTILHHVNPLSSAGHAQFNAALDTIPSGLVWRLDDDNLPAPRFFDALAAAVTDQPAARVYLFPQVAKGRYDEALWRTGIVPAIPKVRIMDSAQYVIRREAIGPIRLMVSRYEADGIFIEDILDRVGSAYHYVTGPPALYNALKP